MPRGVPKNKAYDVQPMDQAELDAMEERTKDKRSPVHEDDFEQPKPINVLKTKDGRAIKQFGDFQKAPQVGHQGTLKAFARIEPDWDEFIPMTMEESLEYQDQGILIGYDADKQLGKIKQPKRGKNEKVPVSSSAHTL